MTKIHPNAIDLLARVYNSHKKGLPEWLKNAREAYLRQGVLVTERAVIIHYSADRNFFECINFGAITGTEIGERYLEWANPNAAGIGIKKGEQEGGQGNGGKAYLRQLFEKGYFVSIKHGRLSVVSFRDAKKYWLDFVPDVEHGKDCDGDNSVLPEVRGYAKEWLKAFGRKPTDDITIVRGV